MMAGSAQRLFLHAVCRSLLTTMGYASLVTIEKGFMSKEQAVRKPCTCR
jgi:hypothetical protein